MVTNITTHRIHIETTTIAVGLPIASGDEFVLQVETQHFFFYRSDMLYVLTPTALKRHHSAKPVDVQAAITRIWQHFQPRPRLY